LALECLFGLVEEPRVLDCDDGLVCERLEELDLLRRERAHFHTADRDAPNPDTISNQGHRERGPVSPASMQLHADRVVLRVEVAGVLRVDRAHVEDGSTDEGSAAERE